VSNKDVRDTQRRPRGRYEESVRTKPTKPPLIAHPRSELRSSSGTGLVPATDDDDSTRASRPYDESSVGRSSRQARAMTNEPLSTQDRVQLEVLSTKYELALHDMACQEKVVQHLRHQLSAAQNAVKAVQRELQLAQTENTKRSQVFEEATRKIFRERIDVDERLRRELQANQQHQTVVTNLQQEIARLSQELQRAQEQSTKEANSETSIVGTTNEAVAEFQTTNPSTALDRATMDAELQTLRSSVVDLEEQLKGEKLAHSLASQEVESLKMERADAQAQIARLTQELMRVVDESVTNNDRLSGGDGAEQLQNEIKLLQEELAPANQRAEESFAIRKKLEDEMAGSEVLAMQYGSRVARMEEQLQEARAEAQKESSTKDVEAKQLRVEVNELKKALSERNSEIVRQAAEHLKERRYLEDELRHWKQNAQCLRNYTNSTDECSGTAESDATVPCRPSQTRTQPRAENMSSTILMDILRKKLDSK
jgi:chromosome segregation ATPase